MTTRLRLRAVMARLGKTAKACLQDELAVGSQLRSSLAERRPAVLRCLRKATEAHAPTPRNPATPMAEARCGYKQSAVYSAVAKQFTPDLVRETPSTDHHVCTLEFHELG